MNSPANGAKILILGILSIVCLPILGPIAWLMGNRALADIDSGQGDPSQRAGVAAGRICGIVGTVVLIIVVAYAVFALSVGVRTMNLAQPATMTHSTKSGNSAPTATIHPMTFQDIHTRQELSVAILARDTNRVTALLDSDPSLVNEGDMIGDTPLVDAASDNNPSIAMLLINRGADVNATDNLGETALDKAVFFQHYDIVEILKKHGARRGKSR